MSLSMAEETITKLYTHFRVTSADSVDLLTIGVCERCGMAVEEPNSITGYLTEKQALNIGLRRVYKDLNEIYPMDNGEYGCDDCFQKSHCMIQCPEEFKEQE